MTRDDFLPADWPAPARVRAGTSLRSGGVSQGPWLSLNLGGHTNDDPAAVAENRTRLRGYLELPAEPAWLQQVHGIDVADAASGPGQTADAAVARSTGAVCVVLTADCLPVLFCDRDGERVAAAHAGWRGLADGVLAATVAALDVDPASLMAWLGPAIGPGAFEVGPEVRDAFLQREPSHELAFRPGATAGKYLGDLYALARGALAAAGVTAVFGGGLCTVSDPARFYSYRRDGVTGRMASLIWLAE